MGTFEAQILFLASSRLHLPVLNPSQMGPEKKEVRCCPSPQRKEGDEVQGRFSGSTLWPLDTEGVGQPYLSFPQAEWLRLGWGRNFLLVLNQHRAYLRGTWGIAGVVSWQLRCINYEGTWKRVFSTFLGGITPSGPEALVLRCGGVSTLRGFWISQLQNWYS